LNEASRWIAAYYLPSQSMYRITFTAPLINQAKKIAFIVYGEKKAQALYEVLRGKNNPHRYPAQLIKPEDGEIFWFIDEEAAEKL
jgi:6-phosphogluconolactonase